MESASRVKHSACVRPSTDTGLEPQGLSSGQPARKSNEKFEWKTRIRARTMVVWTLRSSTVAKISNGKPITGENYSDSGWVAAAESDRPPERSIRKMQFLVL